MVGDTELQTVTYTIEAIVQLDSLIQKLQQLFIGTGNSKQGIQLSPP
jgi:hypothetical protein